MCDMQESVVCKIKVHAIHYILNKEILEFIAKIKVPFLKHQMTFISSVKEEEINLYHKYGLESFSIIVC